MPGAGKTYSRTHDPELKNAAHVDVADVYDDFPGIDYGNAFGEVVNRIVRAMDLEQDIAVEAVFKNGGFQREWIDMIAAVNGYVVEYREFAEKPEVLKERIERQHQEAMQAADGDALKEARAKERTRARLDIVQAYAEGRY
jgi:hypothetical protein